MCHHRGELVRGYAEGGVRLLEPIADLAELVTFQVHPGKCDERRRTRVPARPQVLVVWDGGHRPGGQLSGLAQPAAQRVHERELPEAVA